MIATVAALAVALGIGLAADPAVAAGRAVDAVDAAASVGHPVVGSERTGDLAAAGPAHALLPAGEDGRSWRFRLGAMTGESLRPDADQFAARTRTRSPLLVFLPATGARPRDYRAFLGTATSLGFHVLGLDYWNRGMSVARTCGTDSSCYTAVQRNRFDGSRPGEYSSVSPSGSVLARLIDSLDYLHRSDPRGGWGRYLDDGAPRWNRIVLAGHSQGGGEAAFIANHRTLHGVLMFSSPVDTDGEAAASWLYRPSDTPASRMYGFGSAHDVYADRITGTWSRMGLSTTAIARAGLTGARPADVRGASHQIVTSLDLGTPLHSHGRTVKDSTPRTADGEPVFRPIWRWMLSRVD